MIVLDALAILVGLILIWAGVTSRLTAIVRSDEGDFPSGVGNSLAILGGMIVIGSALT